MKSSGIKAIFFRGLTLAVPLVIILYVFIRVIDMLKKFIEPAATKLGIHKILGGATLTILAVLLILLIVLILGLLMQVSLISTMGKNLEEMIFKFIPSLKHLKVMAADKLNLEHSQNDWRPVLLFFEQKYNAAFIVEENESLITLFVSKGISLKEGEILITHKKEVSLIPMSYDQLNKCSRAFGKGFLSSIKSPEKPKV